MTPRRPATLFRVLGAALLQTTLGFAQMPAPAPPWTALKKLSLEELMNMEVTTVSRRAEKLIETASGIRVITREDIRRSGASTIPEALRLASNLQAAQVGSSYWTIGARGFSSTATTSNKLLVMIDGRSVYTPLFSGVFWDTQDVFLADVDRIEVVNGPGGATWGANAVNGVINILTQNARDTVGSHIYGGAGTEERMFGGVRHGGRLGQGGYYRVYAKHLDMNGSARPNGTNARDRWVLSQLGFRADWDRLAGSQLTFQGDAYTGWVGQPTAARGDLRGANLLARWTRPIHAESEIQIQGYFDTAHRDAPNTFGDRLDTFDLDAQHQFRLGDRHAFVWGLNGRISNDHVRNLPAQAFLPADFTNRLFSGFVQDEIALTPHRLRLTLGAKFEHNNYTGSDFLPSLRLAWRATPQHTLWSAVSRAVRTPSRVDRDLFAPARAPFTVAGGPHFDSEVLLGYEAGWRGRLTRTVSGSVTAFVHDYDELRTLEPPLPLTFDNGLTGKTYGVESFLEHALADWWRWSIGYTLLKKDLRLQAWSRDLNQGRTEISDPEHQAQWRTSLDLHRNFEFDLAVRYIDSVPVFSGGVQTRVPAYAELDARLGWKLRENLELAFIGRNLLDRQHPEAGAPASRREIQRSVSAKVTWHY